MILKIAVFFLLTIILILIFILISKSNEQQIQAQETNQARRQSYRDTMELENLKRARIFDSRAHQESIQWSNPPGSMLNSSYHPQLHSSRSQYSSANTSKRGLYDVLAQPKKYLDGASSLNDNSLEEYQMSLNGSRMDLDQSFMRDRFSKYSRELKNNNNRGLDR